MRRDLFLPFSFSLSIALMGFLLFLPAGNGSWAAEKADQPLVDLGAELAKIKKTEQPAQDDKKQVEKTDDSASDEAKADEKAAKHEESHPIHWSYSGETGPRYWGELSPENQTCKTGRNQSPIDLRDAAAIGTQGLPGLDIVYREVPLKIINNGHSVQVNYPLGSYIKLGNHRYELLQYHFHTPSEHHKEGFAYPMEMHFVHKDGDDNLAVLGVLFQEGETNPYLNGILKRLPKEVGKQEIYEDLKLNPVNFLPANTEFYKYSGSLTTPPCTEGVYWVVFKHPIEASARQIQQMNELMGENARPVQPEFARHLLKSWMEPDSDRQLYEFY